TSMRRRVVCYFSIDNSKFTSCYIYTSSISSSGTDTSVISDLRTGQLGDSSRYIYTCSVPVTLVSTNVQIPQCRASCTIVDPSACFFCGSITCRCIISATSRDYETIQYSRATDTGSCYHSVTITTL